MQNIHLIGAEDVRSAGNAMSRAAEGLRDSASNISWAFEKHQRFMDDWLLRFEQTLNERLK